jgi:predicted transposase/invertase (TIGR01784 family)
MQTTIPAGLSERLVYYASCLFADQLGEGEQYSRLNPVISICFLTRILFSDVPTEHLRFTLSDRRYNVELTEHFQVHTVELPKYNLDEATLRAAPDLAKWAFFLKMAPHLDAVRLRKLLAEAPFQKAIGIVEMISRTPEQRRIHDARQKAIRDQAWILEGTREAAIQEGRKEGIEAGRQEGIELGIQRGDRRGKIHLLQQLLGEELTSDEVLSRLELAEMDAMIAGLLTRVAKPGDVGSP